MQLQVAQAEDLAVCLHSGYLNVNKTSGKVCIWPHVYFLSFPIIRCSLQYSINTRSM